MIVSREKILARWSIQGTIFRSRCLSLIFETDSIPSPFLTPVVTSA